MFHRLTRSRLLWPNREHLPVDSTAIGLDSFNRFYDIYGDQQSLDEPAAADSDDLVVSDDLPASDDCYRPRFGHKARRFLAELLSQLESIVTGTIRPASRLP